MRNIDVCRFFGFKAGTRFLQPSPLDLKISGGFRADSGEQMRSLISLFGAFIADGAD